MSKICLIKQPAGLGDIFFTQKIAQVILSSNEAEKVIWPVIEEYKYLSKYLYSPGVEFISEQEDFPFKDVYNSDSPYLINNPEIFYLPLQHADRSIIGHPVMQAKYAFVHVPYMDWASFFNFRRDFDREKKLIDYLGVSLNEPFNLINKKFGSKNYAYMNNSVQIQLQNGFRNIEMDYLDFDNIFDWIGLMEKAYEIHTVDTAWCYLLQKMEVQNVTVYSRTKDANFFRYVNGIFNPNWKYIL